MTFQIRGLDALFRKLNAIQSQDILIPPLQRAMVRVQGTLSRYPPARPASTYIRTNELGRHWTHTPVSRIPSGVSGRVGNNMIYAPYVQSSLRQATIHQGIWVTDEEAIQRNAAPIIRDFEYAIDKALRTP